MLKDHPQAMYANAVAPGAPPTEQPVSDRVLNRLSGAIQTAQHSAGVLRLLNDRMFGPSPAASAEKQAEEPYGFSDRAGHLLTLLEDTLALVDAQAEYINGHF